MPSTLDLPKALCAAVNAHDLEAIVSVFAADYRAELPLHPVRNFTGNENVRKNWTGMLSLMPNIEARIIRMTEGVDDDGTPTAWAEWEQKGSYADGSGREHFVRGCVVFGVKENKVQWTRFYLEPVETGA